MQKPKSGKMQFKGKKWEPLSMIDALHKGVGMVVQESGTIPGITVAENIFLGETDRFCTKFGFLNKAKIQFLQVLQYLLLQKEVFFLLHQYAVL